jgi:radical SAM-linked protein
MPKYLLTFEKGEPVRWLGHLDILRTFERAIRRAELPIAFSQGFNPRERLVFASALGTGITGEAEIATLELTAPLEPAEILTRLNAALPPGLRIHACEALTDADARDRSHAFDRAEFRLLCGCAPDTNAGTVQEAITHFLHQSEITISREREGKIKKINIRPLVHDLACAPDTLANARVTLNLTIAMTDTGSVRPAEVIQVLSENLPGLNLRRAHRVRLVAGG